MLSTLLTMVSKEWQYVVSIDKYLIDDFFSSIFCVHVIPSTHLGNHTFCSEKL